MADRGTDIKALMAGWQGQFHDLYDAAPPAENDDPRPEVMKDLGSDYRLLCGFSWLTPETRTACLKLFPQGEVLTRLVADWMGPAAPLGEAEARAALAQGCARISEAIGDPSYDEVDAWDELAARLPEIVPDAEAEAAVLFLTELMYWQGSSYTGAHYVCWGVAAPGKKNPFEPFVRIEKGGWRCVAGPEGWVLEDQRR
jgi:hypothetical protein